MGALFSFMQKSDNNPVSTDDQVRQNTTDLCLPREEWIPIFPYENMLHPELYEVSSFGRVKCLKYHGGKHAGILKQSVSNRGGYLQISLPAKKGKFTIQIQRLVADAFLPNDDYLLCVNHKDGDVTNNLLSNLEWVTISENTKIGSGIQNIKEKNQRGVRQFTKDGQFVAKYESVKEAAERNGWKSPNLIACLKGRTESAYGYKWKYIDLLSTVGAKRAVLQYAKDDTFVAEYDSIAEAVRTVGGTNNSLICRCLKGTRKYAYGYKWTYKDIASEYQVKE